MALTDGLVSYWSFDSDATDSVGSNNGTVNGATNTTGKINNGYDFDGTNDYITTPLSVNGVGEFSFSLWCKRDTTGVRHNLLRNYDGSSAQSLVIRFFSDDTIMFNTNDTGTWDNLASVSTFTSGVWYHCVFTYSASTNTKKIYVNNSEVASDTGSSLSGLANGSEVDIGAYDNYDQYNFNGIIDEVGYWTRALTSDEVSELYNSGNGLAYPFSGEPPETPEHNSIFYGVNF